MTFKKERAGIIAMVLFMQVILVTFTIDAALTRDVLIGEVVLPLVIRELVLTVVMLAAAFLGYFIVPIGKKRDVFAISAFGLEGVFWVLSAVWMRMKGVCGATEIVFTLLVCALLAVCAMGHVSLAPRKEKGKWFRVRVMSSLCGLAAMAAALFVALYYRNESLRADVTILMFALCMVCLLAFWWLDNNANHVLSLALILVQVVTYLVCFGRLCRNKEMQSLLGVVMKFAGMTQALMSLALVLTALLAISVLLHYLKNLQIVGKYASSVFSCLVVGLFLLLGGVQASVSEATDIVASDAVTKSEYCVFVLLEDPAQELRDAVAYPFGYAASERRTNAMRLAVEKLKETAGTNLSMREYETPSEAASALLSGEVKALYFEGFYAEVIDSLFEAMEKEGSFSSATRVLATVELVGVDDDPAPTEGPTPTIDPNATPTPTPEQGQLYPGRDPNKPIPFRERPDNSDWNLSERAFTIYISGIDTYGGISARSRSDVNLLLAINPTTKEIGIVTTPRDSYVDIPGKTTKLRDKLTHAGIYGPQYSMATLEYLYGVPVDYYLRVNFSSVVRIVDVLGGVDVNSLYSFTTTEGYSFRKGINHMGGASALAFARERENVPGGDWTRGKHQIELIKGLIAKVTSSKILSNYESLLTTVSKSIQTDVTTEQIAQLAAMQLGDSAEWHITSYETNGTGDMRLCDVMPNDRLWVAILDGGSVAKSASLLSRVLNGERINDTEYTYEQ